MDSFLNRVASCFLAEYGRDIRKFTFVFPNRRAGLFFQKQLSEHINKPIFSPDITTINDCFFNASSRIPADRTAELFRIYRIYRELSGIESEEFDSFYFWGEMLLADFDEVDKHRVDAGQLYKNLVNLREIDAVFEELDEEQREIIRKFWGHFLPEPDKETNKSFIAIWKVLLEIYSKSRKELLDINHATEGMIFREVADLLASGNLPPNFKDKHFVFVGFNALNPCEKILFAELHKRKQADFYWDYEAEELRNPDNKASLFYNENITTFPSKHKITPVSTTLHKKEIELIAVPSSVGQVKAVNNILESMTDTDLQSKNWIDTAVVLPDESLLIPLLHALPAAIEEVNVTMGFPLKATPVTSLFENIFELQRRSNASGKFYHLQVSNILNHPYITGIVGEAVQLYNNRMIAGNAIYVDADFFKEHDLLNQIFILRKNPDEFLPYLINILQLLSIEWQNHSTANDSDGPEAEFIFRYYTAINRMNDVMSSSGSIEMSLETLVRLIRQVSNGITIPFEGEPLNGLQVMGMLETRGLDFETLIITSFNEGVFPKNTRSNSFIPFNLRRAFGLPVDELHDAIAAYNFYRLIQRTDKIYLIYDSRSEGLLTGEVSRYLHQLVYQHNISIKKRQLVYNVNLPAEVPIEVVKSERILAKLNQFTEHHPQKKALSPSALNTYLNCTLKFYFSYIEGLREQDEINESIEAAMFGTLLHHVMERLYGNYKNRLISSETLNELSKNDKRIEDHIHEAFTTKFFKKEDTKEIVLEGSYRLYANILKRFIKKILLRDAERTPFTHLLTEEECHVYYPIFDGENQKNVYIKGVIDRVDQIGDTVHIIDYKTGGDTLEFKEIEQLFEREKLNQPRAVFQTFLYSELLMQSNKEITAIQPEILKVREVYQENFSSRLTQKIKNQSTPVDDYSDYRDEYNVLLKELLEEIYNPGISFKQSSNRDVCRWCSFNTICGINVKQDIF